MFAVKNKSLLQSLLYAIAVAHRQDDSLPVLTRLISQGYDKCIWHIHEDLHHVQDLCDAYNGKEFNLVELVSNLQHAAPIFEHSHVNCFDNKTEIYTKEGWKLFKDLRKDELVCSPNPKTLEWEWQLPYNYIERNCEEGHLYQFSNKWFKFSITGGHRVLYNTGMPESYYKSGDKSLAALRFITAKEIFDNHKKINLNKTSPLINYRIPITITYNDNDNENIKIGKVELTQSEYAKLMGWYLSEGSHFKGKWAYQIDIAQIKPKGREQIEKDLVSALNRNGIKTHWRTNTLEFSSKDLNLYVRKLGGKAWEKRIPQEIFNLNKEAINDFLEAYINGDGSRQITCSLPEQKIPTVGRVIYTTSKFIADGLTEIGMKVGYAIAYQKEVQPGQKFFIKQQNKWYESKHIGYSINFKSNDYFSTYNIEKISYNDKVYCVSVPNGTLLVRSNGKVFISGNCFCWLLCFSSTDKDLGWMVIDWKGEGESGRTVDRTNPKERKQEFQDLYQTYEETLNDLAENKFLTGKLSEPETGIYSFDVSLYNEENYDPNTLRQLDDELLQIILDQATQYGVPVNNAQLEGFEYVFTSYPLSTYQFTPEELREIAWRFKKRSPELQSVITDINKMKDFLIYTQDKLNAKLQEFEGQSY